jgi:hypothetical protein
MKNKKIKQFLFRDWYLCGGEYIRKGCRKVNVVEILYTQIWKWKNETWYMLKLFQEWRKGCLGGDKEEWGRGWIQLWYIVRTFVNVTMYPRYNNNIIKKIKIVIFLLYLCLLLWFACVFIIIWIWIPICYARALSEHGCWVWTLLGSF